ncbi:MAG: hypothetical protein Q9201_007974 [Fulgogasparrea decipioides]
MAAVASYSERPEFNSQPTSRREPEPWGYSMPPNHELKPNTPPPSDPSQGEIGEKFLRNGTPSSTKAPSVMDSSYLSPPRGGKFRPALSDKSRSVSDADSLLDLYGHPRSVAEGTEKSERDVTFEDLYLDEEDPESSRWIHRDKLAMIESHEMQEAGIKLPKQRRSKNSLRPKKSHSRNQSTTSMKDPASAGQAAREDKRQKVQSPVRPPVQEDRIDFDLRTPEEIAADAVAGVGPPVIYNQPYPGKSGSKIPLPKTSPLPIAQGHVERTTPLPRHRGISGNSLGGDEEGFSYNRMRSRSNSVGSRVVPDGAEINGTLTQFSRANNINGSPSSTPKQRLVSKAGSVSDARPKTSNGPRNISEPQKLRPSPSTNKASPGFPRPRSRNGLEARPATAVNRPEGEAPWIADMYKPDPRLPPEQQMLPTHAKRLQQEQREREAKAAGLNPQQQQPKTNQTPERSTGKTRTPSPAIQDSQSPQQQFYTPLQSPQDRDARNEKQTPPERTDPYGAGGQWPLKVAPPVKPPTNIKSNNGNSPTGSGLSPDQSHGGYSTIPKVQSTPPLGSASSPKPMPQAVVQEKAKVKEKSCGCCVVM